MSDNPGPSRICSNDPNFTEVALKWLNECDSDSDCDPDCETKSMHESESEQSAVQRRTPTKCQNKKT